MATDTLGLYYATNRNHLGADRWHPDGYGSKFSDDGVENLRFGRLSVEAETTEVARYLKADMDECGKGDGEGLSAYLANQAQKAKIHAYEEVLSSAIGEDAQKNVQLGSQAMFAELKADMCNKTDVVVYIHGFNVGWTSAVGSALALQTMLQNAPRRDRTQDVLVVLFSWPSDGMALPWVSYKSDRTEAAGSGGAVGRAFLKLRDFLAALHDRARIGGEEMCDQDIHLLCHSMGNYVLQNALIRMAAFTPGSALPRMFEQVFLCAPDVDDNALEDGQPLGMVDQITRNVSVYSNKKDRAMTVSDYTKGNPERLGGTGAAHPTLLHRKVHQIDCTAVVSRAPGHSYYLDGYVAADIRVSIDGWTQDDGRRRRDRDPTLNNVWVMK